MALDVVEETGKPAGTVAGFTAHGSAEPRGQSAVPLSVLFEGRFGRMFRDPSIKIVEHTDNALIHLGKTMREPAGAGPEEDNQNLPAAYTYLGQFVDHDITFDPTSLQQQVNDPDALTDFRTPRYDLDSLYGRGPDDSPYLYEWTGPRFRGIKLLAGRNPDADVDGTPLTRQDLPRNEQGRALIGDPRNDENIIISQLHLAFIKLHDRVVDQIARLKLPDGQPRFTGRRLFEEARRWVRWHYQWMVVHDFLERVCGVAVVDSILKNEGAPTGPTVELQFYQPKEQPFMPIEFSAAAFRFGHSMIRASYDLNDNVLEIPTFVDDPVAAGPFGHLGGFRRLPEGWTIKWRSFVSIGGSTPQLSRKLNTRLTKPLQLLPPGLGTPRRELAVLNLLRGKARSLPTGQSVARKMGITPLTTQQLGLGAFVPQTLTAAQAAALSEDTPLWYYILKEAEIAPQRGARLGPVGGRIVAEVLIASSTATRPRTSAWSPPGSHRAWSARPRSASPATSPWPTCSTSPPAEWKAARASTRPAAHGPRPRIGMQRISTTVIALVGEQARACAKGLGGAANIRVELPDPAAPPLERAAAAWQAATSTQAPYLVHDADPLALVADAWTRCFDEQGPTWTGS